MTTITPLNKVSLNEAHSCSATLPVGQL